MDKPKYDVFGNLIVDNVQSTDYENVIDVGEVITWENDISIDMKCVFKTRLLNNEEYVLLHPVEAIDEMDNLVPMKIMGDTLCCVDNEQIVRVLLNLYIDSNNNKNDAKENSYEKDNI